jgi:hypothetical protein
LKLLPTLPVALILVSRPTQASETNLRSSSVQPKAEWNIKPIEATSPSGRELQSSADAFNYYFIPDAEYTGRLAVKDADAMPGKEIVLSDCNDPEVGDLACVWRIDWQGRFHSALDDTLCMQTGYSGKVVAGARIRLGVCDESEADQIEGQLFVWEEKEAPIKPASRNDLCMLYRGAKPHVGDPIRLVECSRRQEAWSGDEASEYTGFFCGVAGYGGDWCQSECYACDNHEAGGICLDGSVVDTSPAALEAVCDEMNQDYASRDCGGEECETENYCVDCSKFLGYEMEGFHCLDEDQFPEEILEPCLFLNGLLDYDN